MQETSLCNHTDVIRIQKEYAAMQKENYEKSQLIAKHELMK